MTPGENMQTTNYKFCQCKDCRKEGRGNCLKDGLMYESTYIAYATQIFSDFLQLVKGKETFFLNLTDWICHECGKTMTFNLCVRANKQLHSIPLKFGGDDVPLSCQEYNISVFLAELLSLLKEKRYISEITTEQQVSITKFHHGLTFKFM